MKSKSNFNPLEWAKQENAPQKSTVKNQTPVATHSDWAQSDDYAHFIEVKDRIIRSGICITDDYNDWFRILMAIANTYGESGRKDAEELSAMSTKFSQTEFYKKYDNCLGNSHNTITIATFYQMAKDAGIDIRTTRHTQNFCASCADVHTYAKKEEKDKLLIINNNGFMSDSEEACAIAQDAQNDEKEIVFTNTFSNKIDKEDWCKMLRPIVDNTETPEETDKMILGTTGVISGFIPDNIYAVYGQREVYTPIDLIIYGDASSGKGDLPHIMGIINPLKKEIEATYHAEKAEYQNAHALWESKKGKDEQLKRGPEPQEPEFRSPQILGNSSATAALLQLKANDGWGVMFETEGDVVANSFKTDYGDYSTLLRKAAHHEPVGISRVRDKLYIEISKPRLAVVITLTPGQLHNLFPSIENGLPSRFLVYGLNRKLEWKNPFKTIGKPLGEVCDEIGKQYLELHHEIQKLAQRKIQIVLSEDQQQKFNEFFSELLFEQFSMLGEGIEAFIFRLGLSAIRIMMELTILRRYSDWDRSLPLFGEHEQAIVCCEKDFHIAMTMVDTLVNHTAKVFASLNKEDARNIFNHPVDLSAQELRLFNALLEDYTSTDVKNVAISLGINPETARRYSGKFVEQNIALRITNGHYRKINVKK